ncbi:MAG: SAM-dependent DNA methyltransferase, partial [Candidatus Omnitrophica bacterium]|nr:SAM-dependent DNA methyltransferase [Candidatus Omnitrophota bacterium]
EIFEKKDSISFLLCVPGLIFLKFVSHASEKLLEELKKGNIDSDVNQFLDKVLIIPATAKWRYILERASSRDIGTYLDEAMQAIEEMNPPFKLPKEYSSPNINVFALSSFIEKLGEMPDYFHKTGAILSYVYDYIVRKSLLPAPLTSLRETVFAPGSVVKLMVSLLGPKRGKIFDPCCGFGSLLVESIEYLKEKRKSLKRIKFYGQENRLPLFQLCCMHLALYGIDIENMKWHTDISINMDKQRDLKADFLLCAPPYTGSVLSWIKYAETHLSPMGYAALLLSRDSIFLKKGKTNQIHKELVESNRVDCIVNLPGKVLPIAGISLSILILAMDREIKDGKYRYRKDEILFIDAAALPSMTNIKKKEFTIVDINKIVFVYREWRGKQGKTMNKKGYGKILKIET